MKRFPMRWRCTWADGYPEKTQDVGSTFFQPSMGYTYEDIGKIVSLEIGEAVNLSDETGTHFVKRIR